MKLFGWFKRRMPTPQVIEPEAAPIIFRHDARCTTTDGKPPREGCEGIGAPAPINPDTGQHEAYWVLSAEERAKGFIRPVRRTYVHVKCNTTTSMGQAIAETYARNPKFYGSTFCCHCRQHFPLIIDDVPQFRWFDGIGEAVGS